MKIILTAAVIAILVLAGVAIAEPLQGDGSKVVLQGSTTLQGSSEQLQNSNYSVQN